MRVCTRDQVSDLELANGVIQYTLVYASRTTGETDVNECDGWDNELNDQMGQTKDKAIISQISSFPVTTAWVVPL